jgi:hypothetical protein
MTKTPDEWLQDAAMSYGKLKYTQKQATKKGFNLVEEFLLSVRVERRGLFPSLF